MRRSRVNDKRRFWKSYITHHFEEGKKIGKILHVDDQVHHCGLGDESGRGSTSRDPHPYAGKPPKSDFKMFRKKITHLCWGRIIITTLSVSGKHSEAKYLMQATNHSECLSNQPTKVNQTTHDPHYVAHNYCRIDMKAEIKWERTRSSASTIS